MSLGFGSVSLNDSGFELARNFLSSEMAISIINETDSELLRSKGAGIRNVEKKFKSVSELAFSAYIHAQAEKYLPGRATLVRAILFDKSPENNWLVTWHQDKTVAVSSKFEAEGWGPWSLKDGVHHVQPPVEVLEDMVTFRIHLDESNLQNGCLKLIPGSHSMGILSQEQIHDVAKTSTGIPIKAPVLSALVMRPHILHASSRGTEPSRRRILHLEYSSYKLVCGVQWA